MNQQLALFDRTVARGESQLDQQKTFDTVQPSGFTICYYGGEEIPIDSDRTYFEVATWVKGSHRDSSFGRTYSGNAACASHLRSHFQNTPKPGEADYVGFVPRLHTGLKDRVHTN